MSYYTEILLQVVVPKKKLDAIRKELASPPDYVSDGLRLFVSLVGVTCGPTLEFRASGHDFDSEYCEDDEDFVQALKAPWSEIDDIAAWVAGYASRGDRMIVHSVEADGNDFGYQFDGRGNCRCLLPQPYRQWVTPDPPLIEGQKPRRRGSQISGKTWARWPVRSAAHAVDFAWGIIGAVVKELQKPEKPDKKSRKK